MGTIRKSTASVDRFFAEAHDISFHKYVSYQTVEFLWKGSRYRLVSTGDLYILDYSGLPILVRPFEKVYKNEHILCVSAADQRNYYTRKKKQIRLKDLVWAAFGDRDLPKGNHIVCKNGNWRSCGIDNLEVSSYGVSSKGSLL